ncbi:MAG: MBOAT family O-acyltransferase [Burkholderiaceae bacterium]|jgi:alginate O-acetyltransferase complex protein AlgI
MVFASLEFLSLFLPVFLALYALVAPRRRNALLLVGSWIFYGWWSPSFLLLFMALAGLGWYGGLVIARLERGRGLALTLCIGVNLMLLCWFKYANIVVDTVAELLGPGAMAADWQRVVLPIGLSFIVLQSISYLVDVYRRTVPADPSFTSFGAYQSMFVHLIAGPIIRYDWVKRELASRPFDWPQFALGARRFMVGMSMKVLVADTLAPVANLAFSLPQPTLADSWAGCIAYSLQLFFDFAGYSGMAIGLGMMLGFRFPENFRQPYLARSIQDFWRRWHLSLSSWIRDYLYIPLGGNRVSPPRIYLNLLLTMAIAGLWHGGDSWNFLLWGAAHGAALCLARAWDNAGWPAPPQWMSRLLTLLFVMLAWTIFRAHNFDDAMRMYAGQAGRNGVAPGDAMLLLLRPAHGVALALGLACVVAPAVQPWIARRIPSFATRLGAQWPLPAFLLSYALIASRGAVPFLYFQF